MGEYRFTIAGAFSLQRARVLCWKVFVLMQPSAIIRGARLKMVKTTMITTIDGRTRVTHGENLVFTDVRGLSIALAKCSVGTLHLRKVPFSTVSRVNQYISPQ